MDLVVFAHIKLEARSWIFAGAKHLDYLLPGELALFRCVGL
jgi:hypothetical protein